MENKEQKTTSKALQTNVGDQVISRVNQLCEVGFTMPKDYNYINAIKASMLELQEVKDKNGKSVMEVCTPASISSALFSMATKGLDLSKTQAYALIRGNQLCIDPSYFGNVLRVKRIYPNFDPRPRVVHEGDEFETGIDPKTGRRFIVKHVQKLENIDSDFIGAYMYIPTTSGEDELYVMTKKQILTAWSKSSSREQRVHKEFTEKMVSRTIINSGCTMIINSTPELIENESISESENNFNSDNMQIQEAEYTEFEEASIEEPAMIEQETVLESPSVVENISEEIKVSDKNAEELF